jgi:hypothetical protein
MLRYLGRRESGVVLGLPKTRLGPPLVTGASAQENEDGVIVINDDEEEWSVEIDGYVI